MGFLKFWRILAILKYWNFFSKIKLRFSQILTKKTKNGYRWWNKMQIILKCKITKIVKPISLSMKFFVVKYFFGESTQNRSFLWRYPNLKLHVYTNHSRDSVPKFFFWHLHVINKVRSNFRVNRSIICVFKGLRR